ncbi:MAG: inositol monophosphatase family protein [Byssovorax sp.]
MDIGVDKVDGVSAPQGELLPSAAQRSDFASIALLVAEEAAMLVSAGYRTQPHADEKGRHDLVTSYDRASEELLVARLASLSPGIPVVAEERFVPDRDGPGKTGLVWYVDPLDGTTNFVHGHPFWAVSVGLMEDDRPVAGAVVAPSLGVRWAGWVAAPSLEPLITPSPGVAYRNGRACVVSTTERLEHSMIGTGFPANRDEAPANNFDSFVAVKRNARAVRRCGSAAIDLCMVADGTYDGYWERRLGAWDVAAGCAIAIAAGAKITALDGADPTFHTGHVAVSNGRIHDALLAVLAPTLGADRR